MCQGNDVVAARAHINGELLRWAREKAGLSPEDAATRAHVSDLRDIPAAARVIDWEEGRELPTPSQLKALAHVYHRPVLTFYLRKPPAESQNVADFRTLGDVPLRGLSAEMDALVRRLQARQEQVREILVEDEAEPLPFVGSFSLDANVPALVQDMRRLMKLTVADQMRLTDGDALFRMLRMRLEDLGVFVQVLGDLGSHHTQIPAEQFRGLALVDNLAPFIVVNSNDARAAFPFTLLHEAAHIWIGVGGISNASPFDKRIAESLAEQLCNSVATEFLLPRDEFILSWEKKNTNGSIGGIVSALSREWKVSRAAVAHRLWKLRRISEDVWWALYHRYQEEWRRQRDKQREQKGGPDYYVTTKSRLGRSLIRTVLNAVDAGTVTYTQAARILNVNVKSFDGLREGGV